ncbi:MAG: sigma-54-dependent Fis family transcriptional regulator [Hyphomicrobiaceae bacterium]|nr:sigma-54-dependent Fis family transcriptional regulator [Hyphomicrobiaceae bacterium]
MSRDVILIDDEPHLRNATAQGLDLAGFAVRDFADGEQALHGLSRAFAGVIISDIKMPRISGLELMGRVLAIDPEIPVILVTGHGDIPMAVSAIRAGAYDFIEKPFATEMLADAAARAIEKRRLVLENRALKAALSNCSGLEQVIVGRTPAIQRLRSQITAFATTDADVLVSGETGSGKEVVARSLHEYGPRAKGRFVPINCGALPETVIESELFGHEPGAFTGAAKPRVGKLEYASGGTVFLDEIESMPLELQIKLLRVLQDRRIVRLGANEEREIDVRVIAATKEDLKSAAQRGTFRGDLYYRLNVLTLSIPPLRDRRDDIPLLFQSFVDTAASRFKNDPPAVDGAVVAHLLAHDWPGNVRELQNTALRFALGLGLEIDGRAIPVAPHKPGEPASLADQLARYERQIISETLDRTRHSLKATYETLGIARKTLYDKMRRYGLGRPPADDEDA